MQVPPRVRAAGRPGRLGMWISTRGSLEQTLLKTLASLFSVAFIFAAPSASKILHPIPDQVCCR